MDGSGDAAPVLPLWLNMRMRSRRFLLPLLPMLLATVAAGCTGSHGDDDDDDTPPPPYALRFLDTEASPQEELGFHFRVEVTTTDGSQIVPWSGSIAIVSDAGPVAPAAIPVVDGEGAVDLVFEMGGFSPVTFSNPDVQGQLITFNVLPRLPVKSVGAAAFGAVLAEGTTGAWDEDGAWSPAAVADGAGVRLYYASSSSGGAPNIGTAYAADGVTFVKVANPVVGPAAGASACHTNGADRPSIVRLAGGSLVMLYEGVAGTARHLCVATSADGLAFTPQAAIAIDVSSVAGQFDTDAVRSGAMVVRTDGSLVAFYGGESALEVDATNIGPESVSGIGTAVSTNGGLAWTKIPGSIYGAHFTSYLESTNFNSWDGWGVYKPGVFRDGSVYRVWVSGLSGGGPRIGLYETIDPNTFVSHIDNLLETLHEVVPAGATDAFDDGGTEMPSVIEDAGGLRRLYYTGRREADGKARIGAATFP